uniref:Transcription initiation protein spt3 n=1 Tax=Panagrellus redivivus TaxID=6233 RepID=A0A7E4VLS1_PANRE
MHEQKVTATELRNYPVLKIVRCQMFRNGDVEYPIDECVEFVAEIVFNRVKGFVERALASQQKRKANDVEVIDLVDQFRRNPKLLRRLFEYASAVSDSGNYYKVYDVDTSTVNDDVEEEESESTEIKVDGLPQKILDAVNTLAPDGKLAEFIQTEDEKDPKMERTRKIAARIKSMTVEKYRRFSEAGAISFVHNRGKKSKLFDDGFRYYASAPESFNHDMLVILNFVAIEMLSVFVETAHKARVRQFGGLIKDWNNLGAIQLEHYKEANQKISRAAGSSGNTAKPPPAKRRKVETT